MVRRFGVDGERRHLPLPLRDTVGNGRKGGDVEPKETKRKARSNEEDVGREKDEEWTWTRTHPTMEGVEETVQSHVNRRRMETDGHRLQSKEASNRNGRTGLRSMVQSTGLGPTASGRASHKCGRLGPCVKWKRWFRWKKRPSDVGIRPSSNLRRFQLYASAT